MFGSSQSRFQFQVLPNMPVLSGLDDATFGPRLPDSSAVAKIIPLVHVDRHLCELVENPPHEIPTSRPGTPTRRAEEQLGISPSAYFYAGQAQPAFGNTALAFAVDCEHSHTGSATPFDTGGLVSSPAHLRLRLLPDDGDAARIAYEANSRCTLADWREIFGRILAAYFDLCRNYWETRPNRHDPEGLYELNDDWRAWTFEIRFYEGQSIHERAAWCADEAIMNQLRRMSDAQPAAIPGDPPSPLDQFFAGVHPLEPAGTPQFCQRLEQWVREQVSV